MDVPFQDSTGWELQEAERERERERQLLALQTIHPVNIIMQCTKSQQKLNIWEVLLKYCEKAITITL